MTILLVLVLGGCGARHDGAVSAHPASVEPPTEPVVFANNELRVKNRVYPEYPVEARKLGLGKQKCVATVSMDEEGVPYDVQVVGCHEVFAAPTRTALLQWRWRPPMFEGRPVRAQTNIPVTFVMRY